MSTYYVVDLYDFSKYKDPEGRAAKYLREQTGKSHRLSYKNGYIDSFYHYLYIDKDWWFTKIYHGDAQELQDKMQRGHQIIMFSPTKRRRLL